MSCHVANKEVAASAAAPSSPPTSPALAESTASLPIPVVVTGCVQQSDADAEEVTSTSGGSEAAFSIPTVSIEVETSEDSSLSKRWYVPTSTSDFDLAWVQFVMQQYYINTTSDDNISKQPIVKRFTVNMAGSPEDEKAPKGGNQSVLSTSYKIMVDVPDPPTGGEDNSSTSPGSDSDEVFRRESSPVPAKIHHLFVKVPPKQTAKFERMVRRNRTLEHEVKVYHELLRDLQAFIHQRMPRNPIQLNIPKLYHGFTNAEDKEQVDKNPLGGTLLGPQQFNVRDQSVLVIEDLTEKGFKSKDWFKYKLNHQEVLLSLTEMAKFHACGLAYRMSLNEEIDEKYPYLEDDLYTSNMAKELLAKYLDSYLHFLAQLDPSIQEHVLRLRKISNEVFQLLFKLRRPSDPLGTRFNTVCHGDMWMGNLMFRANPETGESEECYMIDFHSAQFLSPATDLAHLLLTSTSRDYRKQHWDEVVKHYYDVFNKTLAEFGLVLRHLGTTYDDFLYEVKRALRGQFLCVAFIIPIVVYCGPTEWRFERRRGSSCDRKNTVRHLIQMMSITESHDEENEDENDEEKEDMDIPIEFMDLYNDDELKQILIDLIHTAADLDILDFKEFCRHIDKPKPLWTKTQATTGKHVPVY